MRAATTDSHSVPAVKPVVPQRTTMKVLLQHIFDSFDDDTLWFGGRFPTVNSAHQLARELVKHPLFDSFIGVVICGHAVMIGVEQQSRSQGWDLGVFVMTERIFLSFHTFELFLRLFASHIACIHDGWVKFDTVLVVSGWIDILMSSIFEETTQVLGPLMVIRTARLMRFCRTMRLLRRFKVLWMLVRGITDSLPTIAYTFLIFIIFLYVFACMGMELVAASHLDPQDEEMNELVRHYFGDLGKAMTTVFQFITLDSCHLIYRPLIERAPFLVIYFMGVFLIVPIGLMNLITAIIVNGAMELADKDKEAIRVHEEQERRRMIKRFEKLFRKIDTDESGFISKEELADFTLGEMHRELTDVLAVTDPLQIFEELDMDHSNAVNITEFCHVLWQEAVSKVPVELRRVDKRVEYLTAQLRELGHSLGMPLGSQALCSERTRRQKSMKSSSKSFRSSAELGRVDAPPDRMGSPTSAGGSVHLPSRMATMSSIGSSVRRLAAVPERSASGISIGSEDDINNVEEPDVYPAPVSGGFVMEVKGDHQDPYDDVVPDELEDYALTSATDDVDTELVLPADDLFSSIAATYASGNVYDVHATKAVVFFGAQHDLETIFGGASVDCCGQHASNQHQEREEQAASCRPMAEMPWSLTPPRKLAQNGGGDFDTDRFSRPGRLGLPDNEDSPLCSPSPKSSLFL
eukprot:TRINITY_DN7083_c0_g2_i1.p1 TRINITY_DN7083_c0_g2~~TRINITY_DN7083_c0_g2_i1.p1  ORF type:complete len:691 (-),score=125.94 TRINITY_DN7083_c0_g2_i1:562-2634(-)